MFVCPSCLLSFAFMNVAILVYAEKEQDICIMCVCVCVCVCVAIVLSEDKPLNCPSKLLMFIVWYMQSN